MLKNISKKWLEYIYFYELKIFLAKGLIGFVEKV